MCQKSCAAMKKFKKFFRGRTPGPPLQADGGDGPYYMCCMCRVHITSTMVRYTRLTWWLRDCYRIRCQQRSLNRHFGQAREEGTSVHSFNIFYLQNQWIKDKFMSSEMRQNSRAAMYKFKNFQGEDPKPPRFKVRGKEEGAGAGRKKGGGTGRGRWGGRGRGERMGEGRRGGGDYVSPRPE